MPPVAWIAEQEDRTDDGGVVYTGRFSAQIDPGVERIEDVGADAAIAWARERADLVWIRLSDSDYLAAGTGHDADAPRWTPGGTVERRRPAGEEWRDRTAGDPPIEWRVWVDIAPHVHAGELDWDALVATAADTAGATRWARGELHVEHQDGEAWWGHYEFDGLGDGDLSGKALHPPVTPRPAAPEGYVGEYRVELIVAAPTAAQAMAEAVARCADAPRWTVGAMAAPASPLV